MSNTDRTEKTQNKSLYVRASKHASKLINSYVQDRDIQDIALDCYMDKRPKTYAETYKGIYDLSCNTKWVWHFISGVIALAFMQFLFRSFIEQMGLSSPPPFLYWTAAAIILAIGEYCQDKTLNTVWKVYFQEGRKLVPGLVFLAALFSLFSVASSGYSAHYFLEGHQFAKFGILLSLFIETMIVVNSYNIHNYRYKTAMSVEMINDYSSSVVQGQNPLVPEFQKPIQNNLAQSGIHLGTKKVNGHHKQPKQELYNNSQKPVVTVHKDVKPKKKNRRKADRNAWSKTYLNGRINTYNRRIEDRGEKGGTDTQNMQMYFLLFLKNNWNNLQDGGVVPDVPNNLRQQFYQTKNSDNIRAYIEKQNSQTVAV